MAAIYTVSAGLLAEDLNQYKTALANVLGITDTAQDALGRLVLPRASSNPAAAVGRAYWHTTTKRLTMYDGANWVSHGSVRQKLEVTLGGDTGLGTSMGLVLSQAIVTTGGSVLVLVTMPWNGLATGSAALRDTSIQIQRDATIIWGPYAQTYYSLASQAMANVLAAFVLDAPAAGSYTYSLYANVDADYSSARAVANLGAGACMQVLELG